MWDRSVVGAITLCPRVCLNINIFQLFIVLSFTYQCFIVTIIFLNTQYKNRHVIINNNNKKRQQPDTVAPVHRADFKIRQGQMPTLPPLK